MNSCKTCLDYKETFKGKGICKLYDEYVNKVVEQLKEYERYVYDAVSDEDNYVIDTEKAIEIVKGAVKDEEEKMNRLTSEDGQLYACGYGRCNDEINCTCGDCHYTEEAFKKLAAYEDTGLQPEHIDSIIGQLLGYLDAEQAGLLIDLPCMIGDTVYQINYDRTIENYKVIGFEIDERGQLYVRALIERPYVATIKLSYRKEDLYFSREEAEKALKE